MTTQLTMESHGFDSIGDWEKFRVCFTFTSRVGFTFLIFSFDYYRTFSIASFVFIYLFIYLLLTTLFSRGSVVYVESFNWYFWRVMDSIPVGDCETVFFFRVSFTLLIFSFKEAQNGFLIFEAPIV